LRRIVAMIERAVTSNQTRLIGRALRHNGPLRQKATKEVLTTAVNKYVPEGMGRFALLEQIAVLPEAPAGEDAVDALAAGVGSVAMDEDGPTGDAVAGGGEEEEEKDEAPRTSILPEVEVYLSLLVLTTLLRHGKVDEAVAAAEALFTATGALNRRSLDPLRSKVFSYLALAHEKKGTLGSLAPTLLAAHRSACLQHDELGQVTLLNILLRTYLEADQVEQAYKLAGKTNFPEKASNNQFCRYLYYTGRISALQLEYGDAYEKLKSSLRKAPQQPGVAGFRRTVQKLMVIVSLLMGEVPERTLFNQPDYRAALAPYLDLTKAVREGNLAAFHQSLATHKVTFQKDKVYTLVIRLSHSVIKTGLRRINVSYSRISFTDICAKLALDSPLSAEYVCAKAIRDGVIDATIDHEKGWMTSKEVMNVYATNEPQQAFHQRVEFCLTVHNEAVRAMRYPADAFKPKPPEKKEDNDKTEEEIAKEIEEELAEED
jgi:26S proteasome regulatory subunit N3